MFVILPKRIKQSAGNNTFAGKVVIIVTFPANLRITTKYTIMETILNKAYVILDKDTRLALWVSLSIERANEWLDELDKKDIFKKTDFVIVEVHII